MKTEKDIRRFMQQNRIAIPKDDAFMKDLVRQINLLPVPAAFENESVAESLRLVHVIRTILKKRARKQVLYLLPVMIVTVAVLLVAVSFLPPASEYDVIDFICTWKYPLLGLTGTMVLVVSIFHTDIVRL